MNSEPRTRIEAAARAVFDTDDELDTGATWDTTGDAVREWCGDVASAALKAADAVGSAPVVERLSQQNERLCEALDALYREIVELEATTSRNIIQPEVMSRARRVLAESSQPQEPK